MSTGNYSWNDVLLSIDVADEARREKREQQDISDEQLAEAEAQAGWGLAGTVLCGALWGPIGSFVCKQIATYGVDAMNKWEYMTVDEGKFYKSEAEEFRKTRDKAADRGDQAQLLNTAIDLASMYVQAGGLKEGFDPTIGKKGDVLGEWGTYGTGVAEWSVFGKGTPTTALDPDTIISGDYTIADKLYEAGIPPPDWSTAGGPSADYVPGLLKGEKDLGLKDLVSAFGGGGSPIDRLIKGS